MLLHFWKSILFASFDYNHLAVILLIVITITAITDAYEIHRGEKHSMKLGLRAFFKRKKSCYVALKIY